MDVPMIPDVLMLNAGESLEGALFRRGDLLDALSVDIYFKDVESRLHNVFDVVTTKLRNHISDTYCHTNPDEKRYWNNKLDKIDFDSAFAVLKRRLDGYEGSLDDIRSILNSLPDFNLYALKTDLKDFITGDDLEDILKNIGLIDEDGAPIIDVDTITNIINNVDLSNYVKKGSVLGTINGIEFREGSSITISGGTSPDGGQYLTAGDLKTINGQSIVGTGDITIDGGGSSFVLNPATSTKLGGIKVGYVNNGKNYKVQLDGDSNAYVNVPWYPGEGGTGYDDTEVRDLISGLQSELSKIQTDIVNTVSTTVSDLFDHEEWLRENFPWDKIFTIDGWDDKINAYFREVGLLNSDGISTLTTIKQTIDSIELRVTQLEHHSGGEGGSSITGAEIATRLTEAGYPIAEMKTFYELLDEDKNVISQLVSGFRTWTEEDRRSFATQYSSFKSETESGFASVNTQVESLDGKITRVQADLTSKYNDIINGTTTISGVLTTANADSALATIFAQNDQAVASIITKVSGDDSFIRLVADEINIDGYLTAWSGTFNGNLHIGNKLTVGDSSEGHIDIYTKSTTHGGFITACNGQDIYTQIGGTEKESQEVVNLFADDGSGFIANEKISWNADGSGHICGMSWNSLGEIISIETAGLGGISIGQPQGDHKSELLLSDHAGIRFSGHSYVSINNVRYEVYENNGFLMLRSV